MSEAKAAVPPALSALQLLPWQRQAWARIAAARAADRMTHAWLVLGAAGVGRRMFVGALAGALLCRAPQADGSACGDCTACRALSGGAHPDAHLLGLDGHLGLAATASLQCDHSLTHWTPDKGSRRRDIAVEGVRSLIERLVVASHSAGLKIAVVAPAESLNEASANALLKLIEEPPQGTILVLIAEQLADLKATIVSRCQRLTMPSPPPSVAAQWLAELRPQQSAERRAQALNAADGAALHALELLDGEGLARIEDWQATLGQLSDGRVDPLQAAAKLAKTDAAAFTAWWLACLIDLLRHRTLGAAARHAEFLAARLPAALSTASVDTAVQAAMEARRGLDRNANPLLTLESLLIDWRGAVAAAAAGK